MNHVSPRSAYVDAPPAASLWGQTGTITLADVGLILRRRLWLLIIPVLFVLAPALYVIAGLAPYYTAQATLVIKPATPTPGAGPAEQLRELQTDMEIITSERLARRVVEAEGLMERAEFNPLAAPPEPLPLGIGIPDWRAALFSVTGGALDLRREATPATTGGILESEVLPRFAKRLNVAPMRESRVVQIQFTSETPEIAQRVPNALADLYITHQLDAKFEAKKVATGWLTNRINELRQTVEQQERQVETYRADAGIVEGRTSTLVAEQLSAVGTELITARGEAQTAAARVREMEQAVRERGARAALEMVATNLNPTTTRVLDRETELRQQLAQLLGNYGNQHPSVLNARQEIDAIERKIAAEARGVIGTAQSAAAVARQRQTNLETALATLEREMARIKAAEIEMRGLEREAATNRTLLEEYLRQMNAQEQMAVEQPDAWVLSPAALPTMQSGPNRKLLGVGALIVAGALWIILVVAAELLERGIRSTEEVRSALDATPLGLVPRIGKTFAGREGRARYVLDKPTSAYAEALRSVHTALRIDQRRGGGWKALMVTSSVANEGKTTLAVSLARQAAQGGERVLLIDGDLRRPNVARLIGKGNLTAPEQPVFGMPEGMIGMDALSGAHVVTADAIGAYLKSQKLPTHMINPTVLMDLLTAAYPHYDLILMDTPPVTAVADARALLAEVPNCLFAVQWKHTAPRTARYAIDQIREAGGHVAGVVVTQVESRKHALYGFGDSAMCQRSAYRYYSS